MISPYVRRLRLADEVRSLRQDAALTQEQLGRRIGKSRADISRLESGHTVDQADVLGILEALGVGGDRWTQIMTIAREASETGWWESHKSMGERQTLIADLEAGASVIRAYEQTFVPGLLQIPEFVRARSVATATLEPVSGTVDGILAGRAGRQRMLRRPGGPTLEVIVDEVAVSRLAAPAHVVKKQLYHLATAVNEDPNITLRVLPVHALIKDFTVPRSAFTMFTYPDPGDPDVVAVDTVTSDLILTAKDQVAPYDRLYERLREAALLPEDSIELLTKAAAGLADA
ncbi:MAG: helix-turn-helix transcriptional regulator [Streptosporangiaceae bacterium]|jgi:transcriptional regulator with XRE-family HTH domain